jgi:hypothetical protein
LLTNQQLPSVGRNSLAVFAGKLQAKLPGERHQLVVSADAVTIAGKPRILQRRVGGQLNYFRKISFACFFMAIYVA